MSDTGKGIALMILTTLVFAIQDALSRYLGEAVNVYMVVMIRYWFLAAFVIWMLRRQGLLRRALGSRRLGLQIFRGLLLTGEVVLMVIAFTRLGLVGTHAIFAAYPLLVAALSAPILGERVGWRRWAAIGVGFVGMLIILQPGRAVFSPWAALPVLTAAMFALYGLLTRLVARDDPGPVSFFWTGIAGAVMATAMGLPHWQPLEGAEWGAMGALCLASALSHWMMIRAYELAEASDLQPFAYFQLVFIAIIGFAVFGETVAPHVMLGAAIVIAAGLFTLMRARARG